MTLASGMLLGLSFPPSPAPVLAWVAWIPLLWVWAQTDSARLMLLRAYAAWLATYAVAFAWPLAHVRPDTALLSLNGLLLLPLLLSLPPALAVPVRRRWGVYAGLAALAAFHLSAEWVMSRGPLAFPWSLLGHTQAEATSVAPLAALAGVPGLTLWLLLLNSFGYLILTAPSLRLRLRHAAGALAILLAGLGYAAWYRATIPPADEAVPIGLVQPAIPAVDWAAVHDTTRAGRLLALTDSLLAATASPPALMIWPETALPVLDASPASRALLRRLQAWVDRTQVPLLTGAIAVPADAPDHYRNSALLLQPGRTVQQHDKIKLVPLAEYVPFSDRFAWLRAFAIPAGGVRGYVPGHRQTVLRIARPDRPPLHVGVLICFESVFGNYVRRYHEQDADLLVTLAQDGWWGPTAGYRQHLAFTRLRAIESSRTLVQVTVSGTTALVRPDGTSAFEVGWMEQGARVVSAPLHDASPPYARWGDVVSILALTLSLLMGLSLALPTSPRPRS